MIVQRALDMHTGSVLLVGQAYGGAVISEAGNHAGGAGLVYVGAAAPDSGQSVNDWWSGYATAAVTDELRPCGEQHTGLSREGVRNYLCQDATTEEADIVFATQRLSVCARQARLSTTAPGTASRHGMLSPHWTTRFPPRSSRTLPSEWVPKSWCFKPAMCPCFPSPAA